MRGASIFHTDAVEFIKCTQPRGALLSLGLVHFMLILWMQWYMKRGTLCAKAPDIGRKCTKRPLTVTASYSTGVYSSFVGTWCSLSYQRMDCTIVPNDHKWYTHQIDMRRQHNSFMYICSMVVYKITPFPQGWWRSIEQGIWCWGGRRCEAQGLCGEQCLFFFISVFRFTDHPDDYLITKPDLRTLSGQTKTEGV